MVSSKTQLDPSRLMRELMMMGVPRQVAERAMTNAAHGKDDKGLTIMTLAEVEEYAMANGLHPKINRIRLNRWCQRKRLQERGRVDGPGPHGVILVALEDVLYLMENPPIAGYHGHRKHEEADED